MCVTLLLYAGSTCECYPTYHHSRSHADENFVAPSTYHQIIEGVDGDGLEIHGKEMLTTTLSLQTGPDEPVGFILLKELVAWF